MVIIVFLLILCISYGITFKDDFPTILITRTLLFFSIILAVLNAGRLLQLL